MKYNPVLNVCLVIAILAGFFGWAPSVSAAPSAVWTFVFLDVNRTTVVIERSDGGTNPLTIEKWDMGGTNYSYSLPISYDNKYYLDINNVRSFGVVGTSGQTFDISALAGWEISSDVLADGSPIIQQIYVPINWIIGLVGDNIVVSRDDSKQDDIYLHRWFSDAEPAEGWVSFNQQFNGYVISFENLNNFAVAGTDRDHYSMTPAVENDWQIDSDFTLWDGSTVFVKKMPTPIVVNQAMNYYRVMKISYTPGAGNGNWGRAVFLIPPGESFEIHGMHVESWILNSWDDPMQKIMQLRSDYADEVNVGIDEIPVLTIVRNPADGRHILQVLEDAVNGPSLTAITNRFVVTTPAQPFSVVLPIIIK